MFSYFLISATLKIIKNWGPSNFISSEQKDWLGLVKQWWSVVHFKGWCPFCSPHVVMNSGSLLTKTKERVLKCPEWGFPAGRLVSACGQEAQWSRKILALNHCFTTFNRNLPKWFAPQGRMVIRCCCHCDAELDTQEENYLLNVQKKKKEKNKEVTLEEWGYNNLKLQSNLIEKKTEEQSFLKIVFFLICIFSQYLADQTFIKKM